MPHAPSVKGGAPCLRVAVLRRRRGVRISSRRTLVLAIWWVQCSVGHGTACPPALLCSAFAVEVFHLYSLPPWRIFAGFRSVVNLLAAVHEDISATNELIHSCRTFRSLVGSFPCLALGVIGDDSHVLRLQSTAAPGVIEYSHGDRFQNSALF